MKCVKCQSILPTHYKKCPVCGYTKFEREAFKPQEKEREEREEVSPFSVSSDFDDYEGE